ncbi:MAG: acetyltransferase [Bdellovibrionales bacterium]
MILILKSLLVGLAHYIFLSLATIFCSTLIVSMFPFKLIGRMLGREQIISQIIRRFYLLWIDFQYLGRIIFTKTNLQVELPPGLSLDKSYLIVSNHISWVDIPIIVQATRGKVPPSIFFIKHEIIYLPFAGLAAWCCDMIFLKRYTKKQMDKNPELRGKDLVTAKEKCERFRNMPTSVINFSEGTRFTVEKHEKTKSKFDHLLNPKVGGVSFIVNAMHPQISEILDVTIAYESSDKLLFKYLTGQMKNIRVYIKSIPINSDWIGNYEEDLEYRAKTKEKMHRIWLEKDQLLEKNITQA